MWQGGRKWGISKYVTPPAITSGTVALSSRSDDPEDRHFETSVHQIFRATDLLGIQISMLIGEYNHTLDDKRRLALPAKFRKEIGERVVVTHGLDNCLFVYPIREWELITEKLSGHSFAGADRRGIDRFFLAGASETDVDSIGRILIPDNLKDYAKLRTKVAVVGVNTRVEIWDEAEWKKYKARISKDANAMAEKLGEMGVL